MSEPADNSSDEYAARALLPEGFRDELPEDAERNATVMRQLLDGFSGHGYERIAPPLIEFEDSLFQGIGRQRADTSFRLMDPLSHRMLALRPDMTVQVARMATTRLAGAARPLRLCYGGQVVRTKGSQVRPCRQFPQAGLELIGGPAEESNLEIVAIAREVMTDIGIDGLSVDLTYPALVPCLTRALGLAEEQAAAAREALAAKDFAALGAFRGEVGDLLRGILGASGPAERAFEVLASLKLPDEAREMADETQRLGERLKQDVAGIALTVDPGDYRGFEYKTGIGFALFAEGIASELGRGGRYEIEHPDGKLEPASGFSVYLDSLAGASNREPADDKLYLPFEIEAGQAARYREGGWRTVRGLEPATSPREEAKRLGCGHYVEGGKIRTTE